MQIHKISQETYPMLVVVVGRQPLFKRYMFYFITFKTYSNIFNVVVEV
jgi:hypothetical protein